MSQLFVLFSGPLPPSRRRSLFTLATSMVLFSSKAFNLFSLADFTKVALQGPTVRWSLWCECCYIDILLLLELLHPTQCTQHYWALEIPTRLLCFNFLFYLIQLDPFLHLVEDHKLKAVNPDQLHIVAYGTEEDDASALDTLSKIAVSTEHSRGTLVYEIVKSLENMCSVSRFLSLPPPLNRPSLGKSTYNHSKLFFSLKWRKCKSSYSLSSCRMMHVHLEPAF